MVGDLYGIKKPTALIIVSSVFYVYGGGTMRRMFGRGFSLETL